MQSRLFWSALLAWLCCLVCWSIVGDVQGQGITWQENYGRSRSAARTQDRPLVILIKSDSCGHCRKFLATTWTDPTVSVAVRKNFVALQLDAKHDARLIKDIDIQGYPTTIFATPDGTILKTTTGYVDSPSMLDHLRQALSDLGKYRREQFSHANFSPPPPSLIAREPVSGSAYDPFAPSPYSSLYSQPAPWSHASSAFSGSSLRYSVAPRRC